MRPSNTLASPEERVSYCMAVVKHGRRDAPLHSHSYHPRTILEGDSLEWLDFIITLEEEFGIELPDDNTLGWRTGEDVLATLKQLGAF